MFLKYSRITYNPTPVREILSKDNCIVCLPIVQWVQLITYSSIRKTITEQFSRREVTSLKPFSLLCLAKIKLSAWNNIYCLYLSTSSLNHKQKIPLEANLLLDVLNNNICCGRLLHLLQCSNFQTIFAQSNLTRDRRCSDEKQENSVIY